MSYVWDRDGLYVGGIFDTVNLNGHLFGDYWLNGDNLTGDIYTDPTTGAVTYFGCGENQGYVFTITGWDNWQRANGALTITTPSTANTGQGLYAEYFDNADLTNRVTTRVDSTVNFTWGTAVPGGTAITAPTSYSARWTGVLTPKYGPSYSATGITGGYFLYPNLPYQGTLHTNALQFGVADNAQCEVKFRGPSIQWYTRMLSDGGTADVYIDGVFQQTVSCQSASEQYQFLRYSNTGLTNADHTLRIVAHGKVYWDYFAEAVGNIDDTGEIYTFYVTSKDGVRLWVNNQLVINNWGDKFVPGEVSGQVKLFAAQPVNVRMDYYNGTGSSAVTLSWSSPNLAKEIIPTSCLYPTRDYFAMPRDINSTVPGTIECENYDSGGEGISYHDLNTDNACYLVDYSGQNDRIYRPREGVDIQGVKFDSMPWAQLGLNDSYMVEGAAGEWMKYTVNVAQTGRYDLSAIVTTGDVDTTWRGVISGGRFHVEVDDINVTGALTVPPCTYSQPFATLTATGVELTAGTHEVKLVFETNATGEGKYTGQFASLQFAYTGSFTPPSVSLTAPAYNNTYTRPATITLNATATSSDGTISKVAFYAGSTKLGEDTSSPYSYTWSNVSQGSYTLRAVATDNDGDVATSSGVVVYINGMAKIPITSSMITVPNWQAGMDGPSGAIKAFDGNTGSWPDMLPFTGCQFVIDLGAGNAKQITLIRTYPRSDQLDRIHGMVYAGSNDGTTWTTLASITSDHTLHWYENTVTNGTAFRYLRVTFGANSAANAAEIEFYTTNTPPTVNLTSPADGVTFTAPATVSVAATASDSDGIGKVEFYAGNQKLCEDTTAPYSYTWSPVPAGSYALTAIAYDIFGVRTNSSTANITVSGNAKLSIASPLITVPNWQSGMDGPSGAIKAFDGNTGTWPDMLPFTGCQFVIDLGAGNAKQITLIRTYPRSDSLDRIHGMVYAGSNDGTTWTTLASITSDHTLHWYENTVANGTAFRYLRITFGPNSAANAAEIEFYTLAGGQVSTSYFSPSAGTYNGHRLVSLYTTTTGATIRFTTDGSTPTQTSGTVYSTPVDITASTTLKAIAYSSGMTDSAVASGAYVINPLQKITVTSGMLSVPNYVAGWGTAASAIAAFNGSTSDYTEILPWDNCQFQVDLGAGNAKQIPMVRVYPRASQPNRINGMVFAGSNDATNWTTLTSITSDNTVHWFEQFIANTTAFRYLRVTFGPGSGANAAEIEYYTLDN